MALCKSGMTDKTSGRAKANPKWVEGGRAGASIRLERWGET